MKFYDMVRLANASLWRNKSRTLLTVLAIFVSAFTIIMTTGINMGVNDYIDRQVASVGAKGYLQVMQKATADRTTSLMGGSNDVQEYTDSTTSHSATMTQVDIDKIRKVKGIKSAKNYKTASSDYVSLGGNNKKYKFNVMILPTESIHLDLAAGRNVDMNSDQAELVLPDKYLSALGFDSAKSALGKEVKIGATASVTKQHDEVTMKIVGVQNESVVGFGSGWINDAAGQAINNIVMAGMPDEYRNQSYEVVAQLETGYYDRADEVKNELKEMGYAAMTLDDSISMMKSFFNAITTVLTIFGAIALVAASIGVINTLYMAVQERTREIGLQKSMGLSSGKVFGMFSLEAIALGFWGGVLAVLAAYIAKAVVNPLASSTFLAGLHGFTLIVFSPVHLILTVVMVMLIAFLAGTLPARRAASKDPIEALRYE